MTKLLTKPQIEQFWRDGYYPPLRVVSEQGAREMRRQLEAYEAEHGGPLKGSVRFKSHLLFKWIEINEDAAFETVKRCNEGKITQEEFEAIVFVKFRAISESNDTALKLLSDRNGTVNFRVDRSD